MDKKNFKILVFSAQEGIYPILELLYSKNCLGGVAFGMGISPAIHQIQQNLIPLGIPMINYLPDHMDEVKAKIAEFSCDVGLIFGFAHILPKEILDSFPRGVYNLHPSPLPYYKGPQPIFWQIKNDEKKTALTLHQVTEQIDAGPIVKSLAFDINPYDTYGLLVSEIQRAAIALTNDFIEILENSKDVFPKNYAQKKINQSSYFPRPKIEDVQIDWENMTREEISALVRASSPMFYGAHTKYNKSSITIVQVTLSKQPTYNVPAGTILSVDEIDGLIVATKNGALRIDIIGISEGMFSGARFAIRFNLEAGMCLE